MLDACFSVRGTDVNSNREKSNEWVVWSSKQSPVETKLAHTVTRGGQNNAFADSLFGAYFRVAARDRVGGPLMGCDLTVLLSHCVCDLSIIWNSSCFCVIWKFDHSADVLNSKQKVRVHTKRLYFFLGWTDSTIDWVLQRQFGSFCTPLSSFDSQYLYSSLYCRISGTSS